MNVSRPQAISAVALVLGAILGVAGTFVPSASLRGLLWGLDGTALVVAAALLTIHYVRRGNDLAASGFLILAVGEGLIVAGSAMSLVESAPLFGAGVGLWSASLTLVSASGAMPRWVNGVGYLAALLFAIVGLQIFLGGALTALAQPLPFFAYPFLAATLFGWAWVQYRNTD